MKKEDIAYSTDNQAYKKFGLKKAKEILLENNSEKADDLIGVLIDANYIPSDNERPKELA